LGLPEIREAEEIVTQEELQLEWDRFFVTAFYERDKISLYKLVDEFKELHDLPSIYEEPMIGLLRYPKLRHHFNNSLGRFVCAYLPTIADALWKYDKSRIDEIVKAVNKLKSTTRNRPADAYKSTKEGQERRNSHTQLLKARMEKKLTNEYFQGHNRGNQWGVVK
jgi:hypothetical protein